MNHLIIRVLVAFILLSHHTGARAQNSELYHRKTFQVGNQTLPYRIMYPENFDRSRKYPLILFLHGAGERGSDNEKQLIHGAAFFASDENRENFKAIVVFPQCRENDYWARVNITPQAGGGRTFDFNPAGEPTIPVTLALGLLETMIKEKWVDKQRIYIGGLSMGGMGTFELLYRKPQIFAAAFPICGGGNPDAINRKVKHVKIWAFHGADDNIVLPDYSARMIEAYKKAGVDAQLTIFPGVGHNSWDNAFEEPGLLQWLFSNRR